MEYKGVKPPYIGGLTAEQDIDTIIIFLKHANFVFKK